MTYLPDATLKHMTRPHHRDIIYHDINPLSPKLRQIDTSSTPVARYKELITDVFKDQLEEGLNESNAKKAYMCQQSEEDKYEYKRMCDQNVILERNQIQKRKDYYNAIQDQQDRRGQVFVDDAQCRNDKVEQHIKSGEGNHLFFKLQDEYDNFKIYNQMTYRSTIEQQVNFKEQVQRQKRQDKENEVNYRKRIEEYLSQLKISEKHEQISNKVHYKQELDKLVQSKSPRRNSGLQITPHQRHNPITNPIDHHIDNPYIMKKIMDRLNRYN